MKINLTTASSILTNYLKKDKKYQKALKIVKTNSKGKIWLIGGYLYKNLIRRIYKKGEKPKDFDFIVKKINTKVILPKRWKIERTYFGDYRFTKNKEQIDVIPMDNFDKRILNGKKPSIPIFLESNMLNIQFFAYDINKEKLIGKHGIKAINDKVVRVYNLKFAKMFSKFKKWTLEEYLRKKAKEVNFTFELPD